MIDNPQLGKAARTSGDLSLVKGMHTIAANVHIKHIAHLDVDCSEEPLVLFFELFLVKDLNGKNTLVGDGSITSKNGEGQRGNDNRK
jgi:hypothetical protein